MNGPTLPELVPAGCSRKTQTLCSLPHKLQMYPQLCSSYCANLSRFQYANLLQAGALDSSHHKPTATTARAAYVPVEVVYTVVHCDPVNTPISALTGSCRSSSCLTLASIWRRRRRRRRGGVLPCAIRWFRAPTTNTPVDVSTRPDHDHTCCLTA